MGILLEVPRCLYKKYVDPHVFSLKFLVIIESLFVCFRWLSRQLDVMMTGGRVPFPVVVARLPPFFAHRPVAAPVFDFSGSKFEFITTKLTKGWNDFSDL